MNIQRDLFGLWLVLSVIWIAGGAWVLWDDLIGNLRPEELAAHATSIPPIPEGYILTSTLENVAVPRLRRVHWSKEASSLRFVFPRWFSPERIMLICHWIIGTMVEAIIRRWCCHVCGNNFISPW
jgi:hypothetical protein